MRILSPEHFKRGIVSKAIFHPGLMFIGLIVILQALQNEGGILHSIRKRSESSTYDPDTVLQATMTFKFWP